MESEKPQQSNIQAIPGPSAWLEQWDGNSDAEPGPHIQSDSEIQASLRSRKEQKRRLQIRTCCQRLHDLLPFVNGRLDTASTLELTAKYMSYLKQTLPKDVLSKVDRALEENRKMAWKKISKAPKKRKTCRLRRKPSEPVIKISSHVRIVGHDLDSYRHIRPKNPAEVNVPTCDADLTTIPVSRPLMRNMAPTPFVNQSTLPPRPLLLDKSTVPHGQMLPVCQNQSAAQLFQPMENNWMISPPVFLHPGAGLVTSQTFQSEMTQSLSACPATTLVPSSVSPGMVNPSPLSPGILDQVLATPDQSWFMNWTSPGALHENQTLQVPVSLNDICPPADVLNALVPPTEFEDREDSSLSTATIPWPDLRDLHMLPTKL